jgi:hypothetical protein
VLAIGDGRRQVQAIRRNGKSDLLVISAETEQWLRDGYAARIASDAVVRDLGPVLAHGEPETGMGQGEAADQATPTPATDPTPATPDAAAAGNGVVAVDFGGLGPAAPDAA